MRSSFLFLTIVAILIATCATVSVFSHESWFPDDHQNKEKYRSIVNRNFEIVRSYRKFRPHINDIKQADPKKCNDCFKVANTVIDLIMSKTGESIAEDVLDGICAKHFSNNTKDASICKEVVNTAIDLLHKGLDELVGSLHFNVSNIICADALKYCTFPCCNQNAPYQPEQRRLGFATSVGVAPLVNFSISWMTLNPTSGDFAQYYINGNQAELYNSSISYGQQSYTFSGFVGYSHGIVMPNLPHNSSITYRVGCSKAMSEWATFRTLPLNIGTPQGRPLRVFLTADMGDQNSQNTRQRLLDQIEQVDAWIHVGDLGYADGESTLWDIWGRDIDPIVSRIPFVVIQGNHELLDNFTAWRVRYNRFNPPAGNGAPAESMYYSLSLGPLNLAMINSETDLNTADITAAQVAWMKPILAEFNSRPGTFLAAMHHRPLVCSNGGSDCGFFGSLLRSQVESTYKQYGVDLVQSGHMHSYERSWPTYDNKLVNASYMFPTSYTQVVNGIPGNKEPIAKMRTHLPWSAFQWTEDYAYQIVEFQQSVVPADGKIHTTMNSVLYRSSDNSVADKFSITSRR